MTDEPTCPRCGHVNAAGANFCSSCGTAISNIADAPTEMLQLEELANDDHPIAGFLVRRGPKAGSRYLLDTAVTSIGRHPDSEIFLDDITVSRRHAEVHHADAGYLVQDVGSLNGTYVNRNRIESATLRPGDELQVGKFKLVFFTGESA